MISSVYVYRGIPERPVQKESIHAKIYRLVQTMALAIRISVSNRTDIRANVNQAIPVRCVKSMWMIAFHNRAIVADASTESMDLFVNVIKVMKVSCAM